MSEIEESFYIEEMRKKLRNLIEEIDKEPILTDEEQKAELMILLHEFNDIKDATQIVLGKIANLDNEALKKMRDLDDKIIYALNTSLPTESFKGQVNSESTCHALYNKLKVGHQQREEAIKSCILVAADSVKSLRESRESNRDDFEIDKQFKSEQRKLRVLQSELNVEDIVKDRSYKAFNERCRAYFRAGSL